MNDMSGIELDMIANNMTPNSPSHPGETLRDEIECRGITQTQLAKEIGVSVSLVNELVNGKRDFSIEYALLLEAALGIDADFWINLQYNYSKAKAKKDQKFMARLASIRKIAAVL